MGRLDRLWVSCNFIPMSIQKKFVYSLIILPFVVSGILFANRETPTKANPKPLSATERQEAKKNWEASPDGIRYKKWQASPAGVKVQASVSKIKKYMRQNAPIEGVVTSLTLPKEAKVGFGLIVRIDGDEFILAFGDESANEFAHLRSLKVNDKIMLKSRTISKAPKYAFPIVGAEFVQREQKLLYTYVSKGGC